MRWLLALLLLAPAACTKKAAEAPASPIEQGKSFYLRHCIACHNADPKVDGAIGPAVYGSSLELLEARVLRAEYPAGYAPKRTTRVMTALPFLKDDIPALHAYLNSP